MLKRGFVLYSFYYSKLFYLFFSLYFRFNFIIFSFSFQCDGSALFSTILPSQIPFSNIDVCTSVSLIFALPLPCFPFTIAYNHICFYYLLLLPMLFAYAVLALFINSCSTIAYSRSMYTIQAHIKQSEMASAWIQYCKCLPFTNYKASILPFML